jgi:hypothetical protein
MALPAAILVGAIILVAGACGDTTDTGAGVGAEPADPADIETPDGDGLPLLVTGTLVDGTLCPGGQRPCLPLDDRSGTDGADDGADGGDADRDDGAIQVVGLLDGGVLTVTDRRPAPEEERDLTDRCDGLDPTGDRDTIAEELAAYHRTIPDDYALTWVSPTDVLHLGVVGDAEPHRAAIEERGLGDQVCVVGGFARSEAELQDISDELGRVVEGWQGDGFDDSFGWGGDPFAGVVVMDLYRIGSDQRADIDRAVGDGVRVRAAIEVLDGTLADLDRALAELAASGPDPDVVMTCGPVRFDTIPADVDGFPPLDEEAEAALAAAASGPAGVEAGSFVETHDWSIASRTEHELILFGVATGTDGADPSSGGPDYADMAFERIDGDWVVRGFGGCRLQVEAPGLGPATLSLDPDREPDPAATELPVLINERACASGQAPVDREIIPVVTETDTTIEIVVLVAPVKGGADCPGNPWHPIIVTLERPLGDRTVLDASVQPAEERSWPPSARDLDG